jgi:hypothetical protein
MFRVGVVLAAVFALNESDRKVLPLLAILFQAFSQNSVRCPQCGQSNSPRGRMIRVALDRFAIVDEENARIGKVAFTAIHRRLL